MVFGLKTEVIVVELENYFNVRFTVPVQDYEAVNDVLERVVAHKITRAMMDALDSPYRQREFVWRLF